MIEGMLDYVMNEIPRDYINMFHILFVSVVLMYFGIFGCSLQTTLGFTMEGSEHVIPEYAFMLLAVLGLLVLVYHVYSYINNDDHSLY